MLGLIRELAGRGEGEGLLLKSKDNYQPKAERKLSSGPKRNQGKGFKKKIISLPYFILVAIHIQGNWLDKTKWWGLASYQDLLKTKSRNRSSEPICPEATQNTLPPTWVFRSMRTHENLKR